ncbi:MAG: hypothetical protein AUG51_09380 [Acidobacteria bacterium 13_1_20CM_3_53_8]|nr:MAG: hypothetical protein AUG51_09380 [Acidobacteria bacterium 13_1_20CM_3_53_8]
MKPRNKKIATLQKAVESGALLGMTFEAEEGYQHMPFSKHKITITKLLKKFRDWRNCLYEFKTEDGEVSTCRAQWLQYWKRVSE